MWYPRAPAAVLAEEGAVLLGLDALGDRVHPERARQRQDRRDDRRGARSSGTRPGSCGRSSRMSTFIARRRASDEWSAPKSSIAARPSAFTSRTTLSVRSGSRIAARSVISRTSLGDRRRGADGRREAAREVIPAQLPRGDVEADRGREALVRPDAGLPADLVDDPEADLVDEAGGLGGGDELVRRHEPALGIVPPDERLHPGDHSAVDVVHRLVVEDHLAVGEGVADAGGEGEALSCVLAFPGVPRECAAAVLGQPERDVRVAQQLGAASGAPIAAPLVALTTNSEPATAIGSRTADSASAASDSTSLAEACVSAPTSSSANSSAPRRARNASRRSATTLRRGPARAAPRPRGMPEAVVDGLEAVDVDDQDGGELGLRPAAGDLPRGVRGSVLP